MSFQQVEEILGGPLPPSARKYTAWWANEGGETTHAQSRAWMQAGRKATVNLTTETVEFFK